MFFGFLQKNEDPFINNMLCTLKISLRNSAIFALIPASSGITSCASEAVAISNGKSDPAWFSRKCILDDDSVISKTEKYRYIKTRARGG